MIAKNIHKDIQETLKNRERALSRKTTSANTEQNPEGLRFEDVASRSTFITMVSNKDNPLLCEVIQGGDLLAGSTKFGYNRVYKKKSDRQIKPISGIKDISVEYKGGYKAIRVGVVNWTASSLDDLDRFTPHFLTIGQTVLLEWGWVFKKNKLNSDLETFYKGMPKELGEGGPLEHPINQEVFQSPTKLIYKNKGNHDAIGGVISNFDCKLNEDGGFDCTTTITSVGINLFESKRIDLDYNNIKIVSNENGEKLSDIDDDNILNTVINLPRILYNYSQPSSKGNNLNLDIERIIKGGDKLGPSPYTQGVLLEENRPLLSPGKKDTIYSDVVITKLSLNVGVKKSFGRKKVTELKTRCDIFVRWGWFEDNILSRYTTFENNSPELTNVFRSVETSMDDLGKPIFDEEGKSVLTDVQIRNDSKYLIPKDVLKFILPGQSVRVSSMGVNFKDEPGVSFRSAYNELMNVNSSSLPFKSSGSGGENYGILRNVLINVKEIQKAFGIKFEKLGSSYVGDIVGTDVATPPENLKTAINNLCNQFSENYHNYWNFQTVEDEFNKNVKIIDSDSKNELKNKDYTKFKGDFVKEGDGVIDTGLPSHKVHKLGIYKFPSFTLGSIVKNQNLSFKIPDAMALTVMYPANKSKESGLNTDTSQDGTGFEFLFAFDKGETFKDERFKNMEYSHKVNEQNSVGNSITGSTANNRVTSEGGFNLDSDVQSAWWNIWSADEGEAYKSDGFGTERSGSDKNTEEIDPNLTQQMNNFRQEINDIITSDLTLNVDQVTSEAVKETKDEQNESFNNEAIPAERWSVAFKMAEDLNDAIDEDGNTVQVTDNLMGNLTNNINSNTGKPTTDRVTKAVVEKQADVIISPINKRFYGVELSIDGTFDITIFTAGVTIIKEKLFKLDNDRLEAQKDFLIPAELDLEVDGIGGVVPGNIINTDYIPKKYNEPMQKQDGSPIGPRTYFQIFGLTQTVGPDGWSTEMTTKMRINTETLIGLIEVQPPFKLKNKESKDYEPDIPADYSSLFPPSDNRIPDEVDNPEPIIGVEEDQVTDILSLEEIEEMTDTPGIAQIPDSSKAIADRRGLGIQPLGNTTVNLSLGLDFKLTRPVFVPRKRIDESEMKFDPSLYELQDQSLVPKDTKEDMKDTETDLDQEPMIRLIEEIEAEAVDPTPVEPTPPPPPPPPPIPKESLKTTYRATKAQNRMIYRLVPAWTPPGANGSKNTSFYNEGRRDKIPLPVRQLFWDSWIEKPNKDGITKLDVATSRDSNGEYVFPPDGRAKREQVEINLGFPTLKWPTSIEELVKYNFAEEGKGTNGWGKTTKMGEDYGDIDAFWENAKGEEIPFRDTVILDDDIFLGDL